MIKYVFDMEQPLRIKAAAEADAQIIGEALEEIRLANGGELEPKKVVDAARAKDHVLHAHFEWDNLKAAEAYRVDQARAIIRVVRVADGEELQGATRAFLSIHDTTGTSYRSIGDVRKSRQLQARLLLQAEQELAAFERRYAELRDVCQLVGEARGKIKDRREKEEVRPQ